MKQYKIMAEGRERGLQRIVTVHAPNLKEAKRTFAKKYPFMILIKFMKLRIKKPN